MAVIATNVASLRAANASVAAGKAQATAMEHLSTGKRINSAKDDAAGLAIASSLTAQVRGMNQDIRNAQDGVSLVQTAEGRSARSRTCFSACESSKFSVRTAPIPPPTAIIVAEQGQLSAQIWDVLKNTSFNGKNPFGAPGDTDERTFTIKAGANGGDIVTVAIDTLLEADTNVNEVSAGVDVYDGTPLGIPSLTHYDAAITQIAGVRAGLGAMQNRLESAVSTLTSNATNMSDARSRIEDADFSTETTALARTQILSQASTAMLAQTDQSQQGVLKLLS